MDKSKEQLEQKNTAESQERAPALSDDKKKEREVNHATEKTEIVLSELKKKIEVIKTSEQYSKEIKNQAQQIENDLDNASHDESIISAKAGEIEALEKQQSASSDNPLEKRWKESSLGKAWVKVTGAVAAIGAFFSGKKSRSELTDYFQGKETAQNEIQKPTKENQDEADENGSENLESNNNENNAYNECLTSLEQNYPNLDHIFLEKRARALADAQSEFEVDGKTFYFAQDKFVTADKSKFDNWSSENNNLGTEIADETKEVPLGKGELQETEEAASLQQQLENDGFNELYILSRMVAAGYVPSKLYGWRKARRPLNRTMRKASAIGNRALEKPFNLKVALAEKLIPSMHERMINEKARLLANGVSAHDYETRLKQYEAIRKDILDGKFTSIDEVKKAYPELIESKNGMIDKLLHAKKRPLRRAVNEMSSKIETYESREKQIKALDTEMKLLQEEVAAKYKALEQLDQQATKDPAKEKQLRAEVTKITDDYNKKLNQLNAETGLRLKGVTSSEIVRLERFGVVKNLVNANGGHMKLIEKVNTRGGKIMMKWAIAGLAWRAGSDIAKQGFFSKETGLDVVDMGAGFVPVAGGLYDMSMAIYGKDLNGREMSTADRRIRGGIGLGTAVLDVFTFGLGGTAIRAGVKGTQVTVKVVKSAVRTERTVSNSAEIGAKIYKGAKGFTQIAMFSGLCYGVVVNVKDFVIDPAKQGGEAGVDMIKAKSETNSSIPV